MAIDLKKTRKLSLKVRRVNLNQPTDLNHSPSQEPEIWIVFNYFGASVLARQRILFTGL